MSSFQSFDSSDDFRFQDAQKGAAASARIRRIPSTTLFQGAREIVICHQGQDYRLLITKAGKLILNK